MSEKTAKYLFSRALYKIMCKKPVKSNKSIIPLKIDRWQTQNIECLV